VPTDKSEPASRTGARKRRTPRLVHKAELTVQINLAARLTNQAARIRLGEVGAWPGQIPILLWLLEKDGIIQKELVELVNMEQSSLAEHLTRMERSGLIYRKRGTEDKRTFRIYLTEYARSIANDIVEELEIGAKQFMVGISAKDMKVFHAVISKVIENLDRFIAKTTAQTQEINQVKKASPSARTRPAPART
jgi:DNA-binding MarR family transcriptional regulator